LWEEAKAFWGGNSLRVELVSTRTCPQWRLAVDSCVLLTTEPNELLAPIHNRMPVILDPKDYDLWLDPDVQEVSRLKPLLRPYALEQMTYYPVNLRVNNPKHDDPLCIEPLTEQRSGLF